jgi:CubicO group peptidase (beta-lactamase class C family)
VKAILALAVAWGMAGVARADRASELDAVVTAYAEDNLWSGTVLVLEGGKPLLAKASGQAVREWGVANTLDAKMRIASITKQFTAMLILEQVARGKLRLDGKVSDYLPWYRKDTGSKVTVHHLISNTSGIPEPKVTPAFGAARRQAWPVTKDFVVAWCMGDLAFEPGSKFEYSNNGFSVAAAILEEVTGQPYGELLRREILEPLGMKDTGVERSQTFVPRRAQGYAMGVPVPAWDMSFYLGAADMYSTVEDLAKWDAALYTDKLLPAKLRNLMFTPVQRGYGYGFVVDKKGGLVMHDGGMAGFSARFIRFVDKKQTVILLSNDGFSSLRALSTDVVAILQGGKATPRKPSITRPLRAITAKGSAAGLAETYRGLKQREPDQWNFAETELNRLGYELLATGRIDDALVAFRLNVEAFPQSWNVHDSLGEVLLEKGDKAGAKASYQRSVELNPKNENGIRVLKELAGDTR